MAPERAKVQALVGKCRGELEANDSASFHLSEVPSCSQEARKGNKGSFGAQVKQWVETVEERYGDLSARLEKLEARTSVALGKPLPRAEEARLRPPSSEYTDPKRTSAARKKDLVMAEIIKTEQDYVRDLEELMELYIKPLDAAAAPPAVRASKDAIFSNIQQLHHFHKKYPSPLCRAIPLTINYNGIFQRILERAPGLHSHSRGRRSLLHKLGKIL